MPRKSAPQAAIDNATKPKPARELSEKAQQFAREWARTGDAGKAAQAAGYSDLGFKSMAARLVQDPRVLAIRDEFKQAQTVVAELDHAEITRFLADIVRADPRELVQHVLLGCTDCFPDEQIEELRRKKQSEAPDPYCPSCQGHGVPRVRFADTRYLSRQAAALYIGTKVTANGMEMQMHDKLAAVEKLAKRVGYYAEDNKQKTAGLAELAAYLAANAAPLPIKHKPDGEDS